ALLRRQRGQIVVGHRLLLGLLLLRGPLRLRLRGRLRLRARQRGEIVVVLREGRDCHHRQRKEEGASHGSGGYHALQKINRSHMVASSYMRRAHVLLVALSDCVRAAVPPPAPAHKPPPPPPPDACATTYNGVFFHATDPSWRY